MSEADLSRPLRVAFVPGVVPTKWFRRWNERMDTPLVEIPHDDPAQLVASGEADMALVRTPVESADELHEVMLYDEARGIATSKDHVLSVTAEFDEVSPGDLEGDVVLLTSTDPNEVREMLPVVASGAGVLFAPRPMLRVLGGRGVIDRTIADDTAADLPATAIRLIWLRERDDEVTQEFVGIVKGRRATSTRSSGAVRGESAQRSSEEPVKLSARQKTLAKQARRAEKAKADKKRRSGGSGGSGGGKGKAGNVGKRGSGSRKRR